MTRALRRIAGVVLAAAMAAGAAALTRVSYTPDGRAQALLRLSWRARGERIERCRTLSDSEFYALPAHMRLREQCEGGIAPYRLTVRVDGAPAAERVLRAPDTRQTRPLFVYLELPLAPGAHALRVTFARADSGAVTDGSESPSSRPAKLADAVTGQLVLDTVVTLQPREVALITYDVDRHALVLRTGARGGDRLE